MNIGYTARDDIDTGCVLLTQTLPVFYLLTQTLTVIYLQRHRLCFTFLQTLTVFYLLTQRLAVFYLPTHRHRLCGWSGMKALVCVSQREDGLHAGWSGMRLVVRV